MKKKLVLTMLALTLAVALIAGGTMAWFTDTDSAGEAVFTAGTLDIELNDAIGGVEFDIGAIDHMNPGDIYKPIVIEITNEGTKKLAWFGDWTFRPETPGDDKLLEKMYIHSAKMEFLEADGDEWEVSDQFITDGRGSGTWPTWYNTLANLSPLNVVTLENWNDNAGMVPGTEFEHMGALIPGNSYRLTVELAFHNGEVNDPNYDDNEYQGDKPGVSPITVGFTVEAYQVNLDALDYAGGALFTNHFSFFEGEIAKQQS